MLWANINIFSLCILHMRAVCLILYLCCVLHVACYVACRCSNYGYNGVLCSCIVFYKSSGKSERESFSALRLRYGSDAHANCGSTDADIYIM